MKIVDEFLLDKLSNEAKLADRLRKNHNLHREGNDPMQRMLNALEPETYIQPHKHENPDKRELFVPIRGSFTLVVFDDAGVIVSEVILSENSSARIAEIEAGVWHTVVCNEPGTIYFEIKDGPYDVNNDKIFASWAPSEQDKTKAEYLRSLKHQLDQRRLRDNPSHS
jgi:cupin fold WbuC family metalloprotein